MIYIKFKYQYDAYQKEDVLTAKVCYNGHQLSLWDTTTEETYVRAMQLADINADVSWDWDDDLEGEVEEHEVGAPTLD